MEITKIALCCIFILQGCLLGVSVQLKVHQIFMITTPLNQLWLYDTTLRDGTQREGLSVSIEDKLRIAHRLDELGIPFIEGGWPGANPKDGQFFQQLQQNPLKQAEAVPFCSTRRPHTKPLIWHVL